MMKRVNIYKRARSRGKGEKENAVWWENIYIIRAFKTYDVSYSQYFNIIIHKPITSWA